MLKWRGGRQRAVQYTTRSSEAWMVCEMYQAISQEWRRWTNVHYPYITVHLTQTIVRNVALPEKYRDKISKTIFTTTSNQNVLGIALELP